MSLEAVLMDGTEIARLASADVPAGSRLVVLPRSTSADRTIASTDVTAIRTVLHRAGLRMAVVAGSPGSFCELNRDPRRASSADGVAFPLCPTLHSVDDDSLLANLAAIGPAVSQAVRLAADLTVHVGPIALAPPHGPFAGGPKGISGLPAGVDPRQGTLLGAAWTAGSIAQVSGRGAHSVTYFETHGPRGLSGHGGPTRDRSAKATAPYPLFHVLHDIGRRQGHAVLATRVPDDGRIGTLFTRRCAAWNVMLVNLTPRSQAIQLANVPARVVRIRTLAEATLAFATSRPTAFAGSYDREGVRAGRLRLTLPSYAVAWIGVHG
jgi:hypothetical protein